MTIALLALALAATIRYALHLRRQRVAARCETAATTIRLHDVRAAARKGAEVTWECAVAAEKAQREAVVANMRADRFQMQLITRSVQLANQAERTLPAAPRRTAMPQALVDAGALDRPADPPVYSLGQPAPIGSNA